VGFDIPTDNRRNYQVNILIRWETLCLY